MVDRTRRFKRVLLVLAITGVYVVGVVATVVITLGGVAGFAAYMDLHGFTAAARVAVVGAVACVVLPAGALVISWRLERIEAELHRARLAALRRPADASATQSSSPARHRKVA